MNRLLLFFLLFPLVALSQPIPPPATQTEVNAGLNKFKYVTPFTLQGWTVGGATGAVTVAQLNAASNAVVAILVANDTTTSNGVVAFELTRNAAVSNALVTLLVANDTTTSNGLVTLETTRNAAVSNAIVTLLVASDTTTSNGAVAFSMQASNDLYAIETIRNAAVSNNIITLLVANDTTTSNGIVTLEITRNAAVSNSVIAYMLGVAVTNGDTRTTWINNLNVGADFRVTNNTVLNGSASVNGGFAVGGSSYFSNNVTIFFQLFVPNDNVTIGGAGGVLNLYGGFSSDSTNAIHTQTEDLSPALGDYILTEDVSSGRLKRVSIGNLPTGSGEVNYNGDAGLTNSTKTSLTHSKAGVTNFLKTVEAGYGLVRTNQGTNLTFALDPSAAGGAGGAFPQLQFKDTGGLAGTTNITFDSTNSTLRIGYPYRYSSGEGSINISNIISGRPALLLAGTGFGTPNWLAIDDTGLQNSRGGSINFSFDADNSSPPNNIASSGNGWVFTNDAMTGGVNFYPNVNGFSDIGYSAFRTRTNWMASADLSSALALRDSSSVNSGRGTILKHPADWKVTNRFSLYITNAQSRQRLGISSASYSGGIADIILTNEPIDAVAAPFLQRGTNLWFDGGASLLYSNHSLTAIDGGLTNMIPTNILDNTEVHLWFNAGIGLTVNFPASAAADYVPDNAVVSANTNCMTHVIFSRRGTTTNITVLTAGLTLNAGNFTEAVTNYATRTITYQNTTRTTNYPTGALTINCATDVRANITNVVASNYAITLATPVLGTAGSLSLVSDNVTARTLAILCPSSTITWMSTNYTANATNILTTVNKRSTFSWRNQLATDGVTTNTSVWVVNQF